MKTSTERRRQWLWFVGLWCAGLAATAILAYLTRWMIIKS
jgi:phage shock protein PspC (stress-responsive transcriptional regulator)